MSRELEAIETLSDVLKIYIMDDEDDSQMKFIIISDPTNFKKALEIAIEALEEKVLMEDDKR